MSSILYRCGQFGLSSECCGDVGPRADVVLDEATHYDRDYHLLRVTDLGSGHERTVGMWTISPLKPHILADHSRRRIYIGLNKAVYIFDLNARELPYETLHLPWIFMDFHFHPPDLLVVFDEIGISVYQCSAGHACLWQKGFSDMIQDHEIADEIIHIGLFEGEKQKISVFTGEIIP